MQNPSKNSKATYWSFVVPSVTSCLSLQSIWKCFKMFQDQRELLWRCFKMFQDQCDDFENVSWSTWMTLIYADSSDLASSVCIGAIPDEKVPICCCLWKVIISAISTFELSPYDMRQPSFAGQSTFANVWKYERAQLLIWYIYTESLSTCWMLTF